MYEMPAVDLKGDRKMFVARFFTENSGFYSQEKSISKTPLKTFQNCIAQNCSKLADYAAEGIWKGSINGLIIWLEFHL